MGEGESKVTVNDASGKRTRTIKLPRIGKRKEELKTVIGAYWQRDSIARQAETVSAQ